MTVVCTLVVVLMRVAVSVVVVDDDDQTPHDVCEAALLVGFEVGPEEAGWTGDEAVEDGVAVVVGVVLLVVVGDDGVDALPELAHETDGDEAFATPAVVAGEDSEGPPQLLQDDAPDPPFSPPHDESPAAG